MSCRIHSRAELRQRRQESPLNISLKFILSGLVFMGLSGLVIAQTFALRYFELRDLFHTPGIVRLSPNYQTVIEFEGLAVERVSSGRADQITAEVADNTIRLRANGSTVNTDLTVTAGGKTALFQLKADNRTQAPRIYLVRDQPPTRSAQGPVGTVIDKSSDVKVEQTSTKAPPLTPPQQAPPQGTDLKAVVYHRGDVLLLQYVLTNTAGGDLLLDPQRLSVKYGNISLPYTLQRLEEEPGRLAEGESAYGTLMIDKAPQDTDKLTLDWTLFRENSSEQLHLVRSLEAIPIGLPESSPDLTR